MPLLESSQSRLNSTSQTSTIVVRIEHSIKYADIVNETKKLETPLPLPVLKDAATEGHFAPLLKRIKGTARLVNEIIAHQSWEREKEAKFNEKLRNFSSNFFNLVGLQIIIVVAGAAFSVISLRQFFVKKHIY